MRDDYAIKVVAYEENEDGSANVELMMDDTIKSTLIEVGFIELLRRHIEDSGIVKDDGTATL